METSAMFSPLLLGVNFDNVTIYPKLRMEIKVLNQRFKLKILLIALTATLFTTAVNAQDVSQVRWKSEAQVTEILGEPQSKSPPIGTHATYSLWTYDGYVVAFANSRAFHLFRIDSLKKMELEEDRPTEGA